MSLIRLAANDEFGAMFTLQRAAFVDEARLYNTPFVPALDETFDEFTSRMQDSTSWVGTDDGRIVGAVSLRDYRVGGPDIERLMVAPDRRGGGLARELLQVAEEFARTQGHGTMQLIVGDLALDNRAMYAHLGWKQHASELLAGFDDVLLHTMTKRLS